MSGRTWAIVTTVQSLVFLGAWFLLAPARGSVTDVAASPADPQAATSVQGARVAEPVSVPRVRPPSSPARAAVEIQSDVEYAIHQGVSLRGDLYAPAEPGAHPALVLVHGGGWQAGTRAGYRYWGPFLAERGYVAFAISYRLSTPQQPNYPQAVQDVKAAVQFLRARGADLKVDPERIGIMGDSAGGHLAALVALSADSPRFANPESPYASISPRVKVAVPVYGVFDLVKQWEHDQLARPRDQITEKHLGGAPMDIMDVFLEASPINWATRHNNAASFLVVYGTADDIVDYQTQSVPFVNALKRAGIYTRTVPMQGAPHFWMWDPIDEPNSWPGFLAPRLLRFLAERL